MADTAANRNNFTKLGGFGFRAKATTRNVWPSH